MPEVYFVRHGQSTWNLQRRVQGRSHEPPLTDLGCEQARQAADVVADVVAGVAADAAGGSQPARIYASDQVRATQTAAIIADRCGLDVVLDERLREHDHGDLTGMTSDEAVAVWDAETAEAFDPDLRQGRTGESTRDVARRFAALWQELAAYDGVVVLVSHGALIQVALAVIAGEDLASMTWHTVGNGDVLNAHGMPLSRAGARHL